MHTPRFIQIHHGDDQALAAEAIRGLLAPAASVAPKFLYDPLGSRLFDAITELAEYYPTRTEAAIFAAHASEIAEAARALTGDAPVLVDLGAGNCQKAARLFATVRPRRYVAVDISTDFLRDSLACLQREHPAMEMIGVGLDFSGGLQLPAGLCDTPSLVFYPGSSIGNFTPDEALSLLRSMRAAAAGGAVLVGVDLVKSRQVLEAAYDDDLGVTAAFNLNLLKNLNRLLGADFDVRQWRHVALFDVARSRIEMHLEARQSLTVRWPGGERPFAQGERIHTENSCKWTPDDFAALLRDAGFTRLHRWTDTRGWFALFLAGA
jgi:L-histidine N-alpha-methyltransferase